jgi:hypothetical protein
MRLLFEAPTLAEQYAPQPGDRRAALVAFEQALARFDAKLGTLPADDAEAWCRALVEEHACDFPAAARWALYEDLTREAARRRRVQTHGPNIIRPSRLLAIFRPVPLVRS